MHEGTVNGFGYEATTAVSSTPQIQFKPRRYSSPFRSPHNVRINNEQSSLFDPSQTNEMAPYMTPNGKLFYPNQVFTPRPLLIDRAQKSKAQKLKSIPIDSGLYNENDVCRNCNNKGLCELGADCVFSYGRKNNSTNLDIFSGIDEDSFLLEFFPSLSPLPRDTHQLSSSPLTMFLNDSKSSAVHQPQGSTGSSSTHTKDSGFSTSRFQTDASEAWSTPASSCFSGFQGDFAEDEENPIARSIQHFLLQSYRNEQMKNNEQHCLQTNSTGLSQNMLPLDLTTSYPLDLSTPSVSTRSRKGSDCFSVGEESCNSFTVSGKQSNGRWYKIKTEPCTTWHTIGSCRHGENCHFYHDKSEKNTAVIKPRLCKTLSEKGSCPYGNNCRFAHSTDELNPKFKTRFCDVYKNTGKCPYGASCTFAHNDREKRKDISTVYKFKTEMCRDWENGRVCSFGAGCHYAHGLHELGNAQGEDDSLDNLLDLIEV